ncbi:hypothetical protein GCM10020220_010980 [Nonomuraea rubra]
MRREVAAHLRRWTEQGLLRAENPDRAAVHLLLLISVSDPSYQGTVPTEEEINETVSSGVRAFLTRLPPLITGAAAGAGAGSSPCLHRVQAQVHPRAAACVQARVHPRAAVAAVAGGPGLSVGCPSVAA